MSTFRCRTTLPEISEWFSVEAETVEDAANEFHYKFEHWFESYSYREEKGPFVHFVKVEVDGHGEFISRMFHHGIFRKGGVKSKHSLSLAQIADRLSWKHDPQLLLSEDEADWTGVDTMKQAEQRRTEDYQRRVKEAEARHLR